MDDLRDHKPIAHILRKKTHCGVGIELCISENPEYDRQNSRNCLCCNEM